MATPNRSIQFVLTLLIASLGLVAAEAQAQQGADLIQMSIEDLVRIKVKAATKTDVTQMEVPQAVTVLSRKDIGRLPANNLGELLRFLPGSNVVRAQTSQNIVGARGSNAFTPSKILILIDGQPIDPTLFSTTWWDLVPISISDIERIEFIRSPGTIYGANAQNGVINIITRTIDPSEPDIHKFNFTGKYGQQRLEQGYIGFLGKARNVSYRFSTEMAKVNAYHHSQRLEIVPGRLSAPGEQSFAKSPNPHQLDVQNYSGAFATKIRDNPLNISVAFKNISHAAGRVPDRLCFVGMDGYIGYINANYSFDSHGMTHTVRLGNDLIDYRFNRNSDAPNEQLTPAEMRLSKLNMGYEVNKALGDRHTLLVGVTTVLETARNVSGEEFLVDRAVHSQPMLQAYFQDEWRVTDKDHLYYGGLFSDHYLSGFNFSPMLAYVRKLSDRNTLRFASYTSHRNPNVFEHSMDYDQVTGAFTKRTHLISNQNLRAERTTSYEAGVRSEFNKNAFLSVDFYVNQVRDGIEWTLVGADNVPAPRPRYRSDNTLRQLVGGLEVSAMYRFAKYWSVENNFSLTTISNTSLRPEYQGSLGAGANNVGQGRYGAEYVPPLIVQPILNFDRSRVHMSFQYQYSAGHTWQWPAWNANTSQDQLLLKPVPGYGVLDSYIGFDLTKEASIGFEGYNLANRLHTEWRGDESYFGREIRVRLNINFDSNLIRRGRQN